MMPTPYMRHTYIISLKNARWLIHTFENGPPRQAHPIYGTR